MTEQELQRMFELRAKEELSDAETEELNGLEQKLKASGEPDGAGQEGGEEPERSMETRISDAVSKAFENVSKGGNKPDMNGAKVTGNREETRSALLANTAEMLRGLMGREDNKVAQAQKSLWEGGHYWGRKEFDGLTRDGFNTLVDEDGQVFMPTAIAQEVFEIEKKVGVVAGRATELDIPEGGILTVPNVASKLEFFAIAEGTEMKARKSSFEKSELHPLQWGVIVPWTVKMQRMAGARLMEVVMRNIAEASAEIKDKAALIADGTSTYHGRKGLEQLAADGVINTATAGSGNTSFSELDPEDYLSAKFQLDPGVRSEGVYIFHPDREEDLFALKDGNNRYYYMNPSETRGNTSILWGRPVLYTEAVNNTDGTSKTVGYYANMRHLLYGRGQNLTTDTLREATIQDVDDSSTIRLGSTYSAALRAVEEFDFNIARPKAFARIQTAAS